MLFIGRKKGGNREGRAATTTYYDGLAMCKRMIKEIKKALALHGLLESLGKHNGNMDLFSFQFCGGGGAAAGWTTFQRMITTSTPS